MLNHDSGQVGRAIRRATDAHSLTRVVEAALLNHFPIAVWRLPGRNEKQAIVNLTTSPVELDLDFSKIQAGFVLAPFLADLANLALYLKADLYVNASGDSRWAGATVDVQNKAIFEKTLSDLSQQKRQAHEVGAASNLTKGMAYKNQPDGHRDVSKGQYCHWVEQAKKQMRENKLHKVVLTRTLQVKLEENFDSLKLFNTLCTAYPSAFVSLVAIPGIGTWIGATPELLLSVDRSELVTVALAGTQSVASDTNQPYVNWGDKEFKEQAFVRNYIRNCFLQQNIYDFIEHEPETVRAGNLLHLQTKFQLRLAQDNFYERATQILKALHPTPAVCGVPKRAALDFILDHESHQREFYTGYLGPVNIDGQSHLFVNLRCMQLKAETAILYAGSGITIDSEPEKEWLEAELKFNTLLNFLNKDSSTAQPEIACFAQDSELM